MENKLKVRNLSLDLVKIIAMFMVLALHINLNNNLPKSLALTLNYGFACIAIPLFFMVSGYLLANKKLNINYSKRKIGGILRFVIITTTIYVIGSFLYDLIVIGHLNLDCYNKLGSYTQWFIQKGGMWQYWYFASMIIIYLISPILDKLIHSDKLLIFLSIAIGISFLFFLLNCYCRFEEHHIKQTYRLWYWIMYFFLGGYIHLHQDKFHKINWKIAFIACILYSLFQYFGPKDMGNEYYFGSILCMLYAICVFSACINTKINANNKIIPNLSSLFLPVYAIHPTLYSTLELFRPELNINENIVYFVTLFVSVMLAIIICEIIMKLPHADNIFKI